MLARLQQAITLTLLGLALAWAAWFGAQGRVLWALGGALLVLFGYAIFLAVEFVLLAATRGSDPAPRASAGQLLRACIEQSPNRAASTAHVCAGV